MHLASIESSYTHDCQHIRSFTHDLLKELEPKAYKLKSSKSSKKNDLDDDVEAKFPKPI